MLWDWDEVIFSILCDLLLWKCGIDILLIKFNWLNTENSQSLTYGAAKVRFTKMIFLEGYVVVVFGNERILIFFEFYQNYGIMDNNKLEVFSSTSTTRRERSDYSHLSAISQLYKCVLFAI